MNKEELRGLILGAIEGEIVCMEVIMNELEKEIRLETLKEVLPEELSFEKNTNFDMTFHNHLMIKFQNAIHQEIIKKSRDNWGIIL